MRLIAIVLLCGAAAASTDLPGEIVQSLDRMEQFREDNLAGYTVTERYTIANSHFNDPAQVVVQTQYKRGEGKTYQVISRTGPSLLRNGVMDQILHEESLMSRGEARRAALVTSANYRLDLIGEAKIGDLACWKFQLAPKVNSPHLILGLLWLNKENGSIVRIEGRPPVSGRFLAGRPDVTREYRFVDGFALAQSSHAVSSGLLQGTTVVDIQYENYILEK